jgi:hypothetical protein
MIVGWNPANTTCDPADAGWQTASSSGDTPSLTLTDHTCDPLSLTFTVDPSSALYAAGFRTFVWTL